MKLAFSEKRSAWGKRLAAREEGKRFFPKKGKVFYKVDGEGANRVGYLDHLVVGLLSRKRGIGTALLKEAMERMRKEGAKRAVLEIRSIQSDAMRKIIEKEGFMLVGYREEPCLVPGELSGRLHDFIKIPIYEKTLK